MDGSNHDPQTTIHGFWATEITETIPHPISSSERQSLILPNSLQSVDLPEGVHPTFIDGATVVTRSWCTEIDMRSIRFAHTCNLAFLFFFVLLINGCASSSTQNVPAACSNNLDSPIQKFCVVTPNVLWRGAKPAPDGAAWLIQHQVRTIVNLELLHDDRQVFGQANLANADKYEVGYFRVPDWEPNAILAPSVLDNHIAHFLAVVSAQPKPIYVHCRSGQNRTGVMVAATESSLKA